MEDRSPADRNQPFDRAGAGSVTIVRGLTGTLRTLLRFPSTFSIHIVLLWRLFLSFSRRASAASARRSPESYISQVAKRRYSFGNERLNCLQLEPLRDPPRAA